MGGDNASSLQQRSSAKAAQQPSDLAPAPPPRRSAESAPDALPKAKLRGAIHHYAVFVAMAMGILLILDAQSPKARWACAIYALSTVAMFGCSALYHRPNWPPHMRPLMRRLDHAAIFLLIAGTNTPLAVLALPPQQATRLLSLIWGGAAIGIVQRLFFSRAPRSLAVALYVGLGWAVLPFARQFAATLHPVDVWLVVAGGITYSVGAIVYALKRPDPVPHIFGYHEVFHTFVTVAALLHFAAVYDVVNTPPLVGGAKA